MAINSESSGSPAEDFKQFRKYTKTKKKSDGFGTNYFYRVNALAYEFYSDVIHEP